ncbi:uncharacterized protein BXZ73DRAFT_39324 [Epithele typhae]|uniref:uncharacterized protein n=1 Tax=Epithele typhae TaxID=378194 RepID=UPI002008998D|nr:uncharacterized protein BXZ73DRAFT_51466 [Epithele typhae]XP_047882924.1 uncharacterized protein BXZ73DRAFT_39324 [Epithele typhae]KAH9921932.1 hypothetical protein BXZ73DRAFT_51466 [Epithele typhae]KAH9944567.1 hypothetical protein BXZ73DRAFT_39324 [Epithele typhae]
MYPTRHWQAWVLDRAKQNASYSCALLSAYNAAALINRSLPPEVLMEVFGHLDHKTYSGIRLLHVCRAWRVLLLSTSEYWANMCRIAMEHTDDTEPRSTRVRERDETFLRLSSPRHIGLSIYQVAMSTREILAPHAHRISSLWLSVSTNMFPTFQRLSESDFLQLTSLSCHHASNFRDPEPSVSRLSRRHSSGTAFPRLQTLAISPYFLHVFRITKLPVLCTLQIEGCLCLWCTFGPPGTHIQQSLMSLLRSVPTLTNLAFLDIRMNLSQLSGEVSSTPLPNLQTLSFNVTQSFSGDSLIQRLEPPWVCSSR